MAVSIAQLTLQRQVLDATRSLRTLASRISGNDEYQRMLPRFRLSPRCRCSLTLHAPSVRVSVARSSSRGDGSDPIRCRVGRSCRQRVVAGQRRNSAAGSHLSPGRAKLEADALAAEAALQTEEAFILRMRLKNGDFPRATDRRHDPDEAALPGPGTPMVVRGENSVVSGIDDLSLEGVLRSELNNGRNSPPIWRSTIGACPVTTTPLIRVGVMGRVNRTGTIIRRRTWRSLTSSCSPVDRPPMPI